MNAADELVAHYIYSGGNPKPLLAILGQLRLRADRSFHTIQAIEADFRQSTLQCVTRRCKRVSCRSQVSSSLHTHNAIANLALVPG